jgi:hypothetical protein
MQKNQGLEKDLLWRCWEKIMNILKHKNRIIIFYVNKTDVHHWELSLHLSNHLGIQKLPY